MKKLNKIPKENIFETPENYFEDLSQNIQRKIATNKKWEWTEETQENIFETPENYFDDLSFQIQSKVQKQKKSKTQLILMGQRKPVWALGTLLMILVLGFVFWNVLSSKKEGKNIAIKPKNIEKAQEIAPKKVFEENNPDIQYQATNTLKIRKEKPLVIPEKVEIKEVQESQDDFLAYEMLLLGEEPTENLEELLENTIPTSDVMQVLAWNDEEELLIYEEELQIDESDFEIN